MRAAGQRGEWSSGLGKWWMMACCILGGLAASEARTTFYVETNGVDNGSACTNLAAPCATIAHALSQAAAGDLILVGGGTHTNGGVEIDRDITIRGQGAQATLWDGKTMFQLIRVQTQAVVVVEELTLANGRGSAGGAVYNQGRLTMNRCVIRNSYTHSGSGGGPGGGLYNGEHMVLNECTVQQNMSGSGNWVGGNGGGVSNDGFLAATNCAFMGNITGSASGSGGSGGTGGSGAGLYNAGFATIVQSTFSGNGTGSGSWKGGSGGALFSTDSSHLELHHCTLAKNAISSGGNGAGFVIQGTGVVSHILCAGNGSDDCYGAILSEGYNLFGELNGCSISGDLTGNLLHTNALVADWNDNGGPTPTCALLPGSPAIDAGDPAFAGLLPVDQRGEPRICGGRMDIGAYEAASGPEGCDEDFDDDGIADGYELQYYDQLSACHPDEDSDQDGASNLDEYISGLSPVSREELFTIGLEAGAESLHVLFRSLSSRRYTLQAADHLEGDWQDVPGQTGLSGSGSNQVIQQDAPAETYYYRVKVSLP